MRILVFLIFTILIACGVNETEVSTTSKIGTSLARCESCKLRATDKIILNKVCTNFENKIKTFTNQNSKFTFNLSGNDCSKNTIAAPNNVAAMRIDVANNKFNVEANQTNASEYITDYESHAYGSLKELCSQRTNSDISAQYEDGGYLYSYSFYNSDTVCDFSKYKGSCIMISKAKKTLAGQYIVKKSEIISVVDDTNYTQLEGVVYKRDRASLCFDEITTSHLSQILDSIN